MSMRIEKASISTGELDEGIIFLPGKIAGLQNQLEETKKTIKALNWKAIKSGPDIFDGKTTGEPFWDIALVLVSELARRPYSDGHEGKALTGANAIHDRLQSLDKRFKENPDGLLLFDRTIFYKEPWGRNTSRAGISLQVGRINNASITFSIRDHARPSYFYSSLDIANSIRVELQGYRQIEGATNRPKPPGWDIEWRDETGLGYDWETINITDFFSFSKYNCEYNGLRQEVLGEPTNHLGGIYIGTDEIRGQLSVLLSTLNKHSNEKDRTKDLLAVQPLIEHLSF